MASTVSTEDVSQLRKTIETLCEAWADYHSQRCEAQNRAEMLLIGTRLGFNLGSMSTYEESAYRLGKWSEWRRMSPEEEDTMQIDGIVQDVTVDDGSIRVELASQRRVPRRGEYPIRFRLYLDRSVGLRTALLD